MWDKIIELMEAHNSFLLTTHVNPDADGIGAASALIELLLMKGKKVRFVCDSPIPQKFSFLDFHQLHGTYDGISNYPDTEVLVLLDANRLERIGRVAKLATSARPILCIDHHAIKTPFRDWAKIIDTTACSAGAMIYHLFKYAGLPLNLHAATGIYASILCDTGRFSYSSTSGQAHLIAEECIRLGVDPAKMHARLFQHLTIAETKIFATALHKMETFFDNKIVVQQIRLGEWEENCTADQIEHSDLEYIHDFNYQIGDVHCFVLLRELSPYHVRVSVRSRSWIDISQIVAKLGGGGHAHAGGISWNGPLEEIKCLILNELREAITQVC
jgi:phosphoesterase RecJ-like protein